MAQPTGAFSSYDAVGNREDLSDVIFDVSPTATPVLSSIKKGKATGTNHEWQTDSLAAAADNAHIEGNDANPATASATTRLGNYTQILKKHAVVTGTQQDGVDPAGREKEMAYQEAKRMKEIKRDLERALVGVNNAKVAGNDTTAREMASFQTYLTSNTSAGATGADAAGTGADARTDGTQRALTEAILEPVLQSIWDNSDESSSIDAHVGSHVKGVASDFTTAATRYVSSDDKKLVASIDVYDGDFQTVKFVPNRFSRSRDLVLVNPSYAKLAEMRPLSSYDLAKTGDSYRREMVMECTLEVCNEAAHGLVADLSTS